MPRLDSPPPDPRPSRKERAARDAISAAWLLTAVTVCVLAVGLAVVRSTSSPIEKVDPQLSAAPEEGDPFTKPAAPRRQPDPIVLRPSPVEPEEPPKQEATPPPAQSNPLGPRYRAASETSPVGGAR